jgi:hypothetical protein
MPEYRYYASAEEALRDLSRNVPGGLASMTEPWWGSMESGPMLNLGYVIGRRTPTNNGRNVVGYRYDFDPLIGFHINVEGVANFPDHLVVSNGNAESRVQYWESLTAHFRDVVPPHIRVALGVRAANTTGSFTPVIQSYAVHRVNELQIRWHLIGNPDPNRCNPNPNPSRG